MKKIDEVAKEYVNHERKIAGKLGHGVFYWNQMYDMYCCVKCGRDMYSISIKKILCRMQ